MASDFEDHVWKDVVPKTILDIYQAYERGIHVGRKLALLAIDLYQLADDGGPLPVEQAV